MMENETPIPDPLLQHATHRVRKLYGHVRVYRSLLILVALLWFALAIVTVYRERSHAETIRLLEQKHTAELKLRDSVHRTDLKRREFERINGG